MTQQHEFILRLGEDASILREADLRPRRLVMVITALLIIITFQQFLGEDRPAGPVDQVVREQTPHVPLQVDCQRAVSREV